MGLTFRKRCRFLLINTVLPLNVLARIIDEGGGIGSVVGRFKLKRVGRPKIEVGSGSSSNSSAYEN